MAGWKIVLQRRLPLCRIVLHPLEILSEQHSMSVWGEEDV
jgi:hypothetical protein